MCYFMIAVLMTAVLPQVCHLPNAETVPSQLAPANQTTQNYQCQWGPLWLSQLDTVEQEHIGDIELSYQGKSSTAEAIAESLIYECSQHLAKMTAALGSMAACPPCQTLVARDQQNLDFMKWWLQNRRAQQHVR